MATQLAKHETTDLAPVTDMAGGLLAVIERAARDPSVDMDKMERLLAMQERVQARAAQEAFTAAKIAMRPDLPEVTMRGRIIIHDKNDKTKVLQETAFVRFEDLHDAIMPVLSRHGFDLAFKNDTAPDGKVRVITILSHVTGHEERTHFDLPHDSSGSKNPVQAVGSSTSYGKRYGTLSILNIKVSGEDDDGIGAVPETRIERPIETPRDAPFPQGPAKNKTALKDMGRALWRDVEACGDNDELDILLADNRELIAQLKTALPKWWDGDERDGNGFEGLGAVITRRQAEFQNQG